MHKRDFGSFHSSNVQELLNLNECDYVPPQYPIDLPVFEDGDDLIFNKDLKQKYFLLEDNCVFLNHGAFGGVLKLALEAAQKWQHYAERQPLRFYDRQLLPLLADVTRRLAKFIDCSPTDLVLTTNATTALNSVVRSFNFKPDDIIFILSTTYGAVKTLIKQICKETGAVLKEVEVSYPITGSQQFIELVDKELNDEKIKLAVFDHIPSNLPVILPIQDMINICHLRNVPVLVDGAHSLGNISLQLRSLDVDFYVSNAHKWFCCPKAAAFLYVKPVYQSMIRPLVISHGFGSGFNSEFIWTGLQDYSGYLALYTVIDFWKKKGVEKILQHNHNLARRAGKLLCDAWKTNLMAPEDMFGSMVLVELPKTISKMEEPTYLEAERIQNILFHDFNIEVPIKYIGGKLCVRVSSHIYNTIDEYKVLADSIAEICNELQSNKR